jgi:hypothetical protein
MVSGVVEPFAIPCCASLNLEIIDHHGKERVCLWLLDEGWSGSAKVDLAL